MHRSVLLRAGAALATGLCFLGANAYVIGHPKNPAAPLQPPAAGDIVLRDAVRPSVTPAATGRPQPATTAPSRSTPRATARPAPQITLQPGVRATALPGLTYTHVS